MASMKILIVLLLLVNSVLSDLEKPSENSKVVSSSTSVSTSSASSTSPKLGATSLASSASIASSASSATIIKDEPQSECHALYLTQYLNAGNYKEAQKLAYVRLHCPDNCTVESYSGYLTVKEKYDANFHMRYFAAQTDPVNAPVIFYFEGGPFMSVIPTVFSITSFRINSKLELECHDDHWNMDYHLVFIDHPFGTGFSFTNCSDGYDKTETDTRNSLYSAFKQFFLMFPNLKQNNIYLHSHSLGSWYTPYLAEMILNDKINKFKFQGMIFGNPFLDAFYQSNFGDLPYHLGLLNLKDYKRLVEQQNKLKKQLMDKDYEAASYTYTSIMYPPSLSGTLFGNMTGFSTAYNFLRTKYNDTYVKMVIKYVTRSDIRCALHVKPVLKFELENLELITYIRTYNRWITIIPQINYILKSNVTVLIYNGDFDLFTPHLATVKVLSNLTDYGALYQKASRKKWFIRRDVCTTDMTEQWGSCDNNLAGYITEVKKYGNLIHAYIRGGGHFVMLDQDIRTRALLHLYIS